MCFSTTYSSPLGVLTLACREAGLAGLWLPGQKRFGGALAGKMAVNDAAPAFAKAKDWLDRYFAGRKPEGAELPLAPDGSEFRREVWKMLCAIPYGRTTTYGEIARAMAARLKRPAMSARAVGGAVGHNPIAIVIPCHRVVGADGGLTGYAGGLAAKARLLAHEGVSS